MCSYAQALRECKEVLQEYQLYVPEIDIDGAATFLSYTDTRSEVRIGLGVRVLSVVAGSEHMVWTVMHEVMHVLFARFKPSKKIRDVFGTRTEWRAEQRLMKWLRDDEEYVSRYAQTHPEEDFVETATFYLLRGIPGWDEAVMEKGEAIEEWFDSVRRRAKRKR